MEDFLALADDRAVACKDCLFKRSREIRDLLVVDADAALLHETAALALGCGKAPHLTSSVRVSILPSVKSSSVSSVDGIFSLLPLPPKRAFALASAFFASSSPWTICVSS